MALHPKSFSDGDVIRIWKDHLDPGERERVLEFFCLLCDAKREVQATEHISQHTLVDLLKATIPFFRRTFPLTSVIFQTLNLVDELLHELRGFELSPPPRCAPPLPTPGPVLHKHVQEHRHISELRHVHQIDHRHVFEHRHVVPEPPPPPPPPPVQVPPPSGEEIRFPSGIVRRPDGQVGYYAGGRFISFFTVGFGGGGGGDGAGSVGGAATSGGAGAASVGGGVGL